MICVGNRLRDGLMMGGEKQADGFCQGRSLASPSHLSGLSLHKRLGRRE